MKNSFNKSSEVVTPVNIQSQQEVEAVTSVVTQAVPSQINPLGQARSLARLNRINFLRRYPKVSRKGIPLRIYPLRREVA